jgi:putative selenium metabolism protein SsnA
MTPDLLLTHANLVTFEQPNRILPDHALLLRGGLIHDLGSSPELEQRYPDAERLDAGGQYLLPGNICAHTHFYGAFARGMAIPGEPPDTFVKILQKLWWPLDLALDEEAVQLSALVCLVDAVKHGTTTLFDHHASPNAIPGSLDLIAEAVEQAGVRAALCYEVTDRNGEAGAQAGIAENLRFLNKCQQAPMEPQPRLAALFGLHASLTLSDRTLADCREAAPAGTGFHVHVAEGVADQEDSLRKSGCRVVERLNRFGMLDHASIFVHAVHVDPAEIDLLAESGTWVTHQPRSNMNNAVGVADVAAMLQRGVKVGLGNDGFSNLMWEEWKTAYLLHKAWHGDPRRMPAPDVLQMAVYHNAALASQYFPGAPIGVIEKGAAADLILVDYHPYTPLTLGNLPWHILFGFHESLITTTICAGKVLMKDRQLVTLDEAAIAAQARESAVKVWQRFAESANLR